MSFILPPYCPWQLGLILYVKFKLLPVVVLNKCLWNTLNDHENPKVRICLIGVWGEGGWGTCVLVLFMWNIIDTDRWQRQETFTLFHDKHSYIGVPSSEKKKRRTATKSGILSRSRFAKLGDRDKKVSPSSATATNFKMRGGRYRRPRQKCVADFGDRDRFQSEGRPVSATATKKCRPLRRPRQISK